MKSYMKYYKGDVDIEVGQYTSNGNTSLRLVSTSGEPLAHATTNLGDSLLPNYAYIKDYAENEGVLENKP